MSNVRLTDAGLAVLVDGGTRQVLHPEITIHDILPLEAYDGLAPELIGTQAAPSASSELYALGCLLWQLLAGRPPFTTADPLAKLAAHQTQTIEDVRIWAPETPSLLAEMIRQMTSPAIAVRPRGFDEVLQRWGRSGLFGRSRLRHFRRLFDCAVPHFSSSTISGGQSHRAWIGAALIAFIGGAAMLYDNGLRSELLEIVQHVRSVVHDPTSTGAPVTNNATVGSNRNSKHQRGPLPFPLPSADGVIVLEEQGPYSANGVITFAGPLTIRAGAGVKPEIHVDDAPLCLVAQSVTLEHLTIRCRNNFDSVMLTKIRSQQLSVRNCEFTTAAHDSAANDSTTSSPAEIASLAWSPLDSRDPKSGQIAIKNSVFHGSGAAILFAQSPRSLAVSNTLKAGSGAFASLGPKCLAMPLMIDLDHLTLRDTGPLLRLAGELARKTGAAPTQIAANDCVFSLADARSGFIVVDSDRPRADLAKSIEMTAKESVIAPGTSLLTTFDAASHQIHQLDADEQFDGLVASEIEFAGPKPHRTADSKTARLQGPRVAQAADDLPGIDLRRLGPAN